MKRDPQTLEASLAALEQQHLARRRSTVEAFPESGHRAELLIDGRRLIDFCSNDYLGLARHPDMAAAMRVAADREGAGSAASHLVTGHGIEHARLEEEVAAYTGRERALLFSTGYMANLAAITCLAEPGEFVLLDRLNHASLIDAALLCRARFNRYPHCDAHAARELLNANSQRAAVVATDGVFSMDGDLAPLPALAAAEPRTPRLAGGRRCARAWA